MNSQPIKSNLRFTIFLLLILLNSCSDKKNQTGEMIDEYKIQLNEDLVELKDNKLITQEELKQINEKLNSDFEYYRNNQDIDSNELKKMFHDSVNSFENIVINHSIYVLISGTYSSITGQIAMRNFPIKQEDFVIQTELSNEMINWFESYQNDDQKLSDLLANINKVKKLKIYTNISDQEYNDIISSIDRIKNDSTISHNEIKQILTSGMMNYCDKDNDTNFYIFSIYYDIDRINQIGIHDQLERMLDKKWTAPEEPSFTELKQQVTNELKRLLEDEFITTQEFEKLKTIIIEDINFCEKNSNKKTIKTKLLASLKKLKPIFLDTEDRESVVDWYFILSKKTKVDINKDLNKWLYGFDVI